MIEPDEQLGGGIDELRLCDLGSLIVRVNDVEVVLRGDKPMRILATLLIHANRRVPVDILYETVWPHETSVAGSGTLESHIWRLRKVLEPRRARRHQPSYLVNDAGGYRLILNPANADSLRFAQLSDQGDRLLANGDAQRALGRYDEALSLWRGRPFEPLADEELASATIARLEETHDLVREQRIEALLQLRAAAGVIAELEELVRRLPFRERLWGQLMLALYQAGRIQDALDTYRRARSVLLDELGVDPGASLQTLHQRMLRQDPGLVPAPHPTHARVSDSPRSHAAGVHLPARLSRLIGRSEELARISELVRRRRLVTMVGTAGCGKTRLAIDVARSAADVASDGIWFVDLTAVDGADAVLGLVAATIGVEQPAVGTTMTALRDYVRDRPILLLLDNCEHVLPAIHRLVDILLTDDSQCRILATSREPIALDGEVLWTLAPLPTQDDSDSTGMSPAAELFIERASSSDPLFAPTPAELAEIEKICAAIDGLPLAIELAASRIRDASLTEVYRVVETAPGSLSHLGYQQAQHHRTVEASIDWSVQLLETDERFVHARVSALPGVFTVEAGRAVAGGDPVRPEDVRRILTQLAHRSLLSPVIGNPIGRPTRYRQLATVRAHGAQLLASTLASDSTRRARRDFVVDLVRSCPAPSAEDVGSRYATVSDNHDTVVAVLHDTIYDHPDPVGAHILGRLASYWFYRGRVAEGTRWLEAAAERRAQPEDRSLVQLALAYAHALRDRTDLSLPLVQEALALSPRREDRERYAYGLVAAAWCVWVRADPALDFVDHEVRRLADGDPVIDAWADVLAAKTAFAVDGPAVTAGRAGELIERSTRVGNVSAAWLAANLAALSDLLLGDAATGRSRMRQVENYYSRLGGGRAANNIEFDANFAALAGDFEEAARHYGTASALAYRSGTLWPLSPSTGDLLATTRHALPSDAFDAAWQSGDALARHPG